MKHTPPNHAQSAYSPLYFLASLGAGGMTVTFFLWLMFWVPHPGAPVPVFEDIAGYFSLGTSLQRVMVIGALAAIAIFATIHFWLLTWNFIQLSRFRKSVAYQALHTSNAETQMKAVPLTLAMAVNVGFILGLVFVPQLWSVVEYLFPLAMIAFVAIGIFAFRLLGRFYGRVLAEGGFDHDANNSFAQLLPAFALSMIAVGLAAPAAMSTSPTVVGVSLTLSTFFIATSFIVTIISLILAVPPMLQKGAAPEGAPTLMVVIPILTVLGIAMMRLSHGLHTQFDVHTSAGETLVFLTRIVAAQVLFGMLGVLVLRRQNYFGRFLSFEGTRSAGSYALACPGVALSVMWQFWVHKGLVATGILVKFSMVYWVILLPAFIAQVVVIVLLIRLHRLHFSGRGRDVQPVAAE